MHLKSCVKLVRSELRLDLGQQQGALLRRSHSNRLPLAALSTNTLRCGPQGGAVHGGASRAKGSENSGFTEDEACGLDVWTVIRPGHVREKIALFAHDGDRTAKGSWDVSAKRRRRTSQIQPLQAPQPTVTIQTAARDPPSDPPLDPPPDAPEDDPKLSVVEMVAFLEQRVTCSPHAKLRSSASITLSRAPPPSSLPQVLNPAPPERPAPAEEPESLSVSDMVAKLESQCLRRRTQNERRAVGRVLLADPTPLSVIHPQPISSPEMLKSPPPDSSSQTRKTSVATIHKSDIKVKPCFSAETKVQKTVLVPPTSPERRGTIGRGRTETPPLSLIKQSKSEPVLFCKPEKNENSKTNRDFREIQKPAVSSAAILTLSVRPGVTVATKVSTEATSSAESVKEAEVLSEKDSKQTELNLPKPNQDKTSSLLPQISPLPSPKSEKLSPHEEPLPGLLFLTPPPKPCVQSEQRNNKTERRMTDPENSDSFMVLSHDLAVQSRTRTSSPSPASIPPSRQSEKRKHQPRGDFTIQSEESKPHEVESRRTHLTFTEKRKSCPVTATERGVQSEASIELLPPESQSRRRRLNRLAQSEKRRSCPVPEADWTNPQNEAVKPHPAAPDLLVLSSSDLSSQSETRRVPRPTTCSDQSELRACGSVLLRSSSDVGADRRRRRKAARAFSLCSVEGAGSYGEGAGRAASEDFLLMRRRLQSLLEPRTQVSYLSLLPHHLLVQILLLLPTRALAALKCSCQYLRLIIDTYDPRPLDALWVCDPRYRDDPCKQCKRRHRRGDVSLCRWHHKPFCQAMPYGPGYWMCCHGDRRDAPGCNVGLHDNRWVPAFHSINAPLYRQRPREEHEDAKN